MLTKKITKISKEASSAAEFSTNTIDNPSASSSALGKASKKASLYAEFLTITIDNTPASSSSSFVKEPYKPEWKNDIISDPETYTFG
eukprot:1849569-Ditylum_brightwellii.AAC.1